MCVCTCRISGPTCHSVLSDSSMHSSSNKASPYQRDCRSELYKINAKHLYHVHNTGMFQWIDRVGGGSLYIKGCEVKLILLAKHGKKLCPILAMRKHCHCISARLVRQQLGSYVSKQQARGITCSQAPPPPPLPPALIAL